MSLDLAPSPQVRAARVSERTMTRIAIQAPDPLSHAGIRRHIEPHQDFELLPDGRQSDADILVMVAKTVDPRVMTQLRSLANTISARVALILDELGEVDLLTLVDVGVRAVLWRVDATAQRLLHMVRTVSQGGVEMPSEVQSKLVADVARLQRTVLAPRGLTGSGLTDREIEVLRLLADGLDTAEIAKKMRYSERTVKGILYGLTGRLQLRSRAHAVAYALRAGLV